PAWPAHGLAVCAAVGIQRVPVLCSDGSTGAIVTWCDRRTPANENDIYAQHIRVNGTVDPAWPVNGMTVVARAAQQLLQASAAFGTTVLWIDTASADNQGEVIV